MLGGLLIRFAGLNHVSGSAANPQWSAAVLLVL
jgi:hypothetical protein